MVVGGNSGPYIRSVSGFIVIEDAEPYGEPNVLAQTMKNLLESKAFPRPINGPHLQDSVRRRKPKEKKSKNTHQSSTSALPVNA